MKCLENQNSIVARFSMSRREGPVVILSQKHLIQEMKRCCINTSSETTLSILCMYKPHRVQQLMFLFIRYRYNF